LVDRATQERWSNAVIAALRLAHPHVLPELALERGR
jgi:hypothetical protein